MNLSSRQIAYLRRARKARDANNSNERKKQAVSHSRLRKISLAVKKQPLP